MEAVASYVVKHCLITLTLYGYYYFISRNKPMHRWNRFFLLMKVLAGVVIPFVTISSFYSAVS